MDKWRVFGAAAVDGTWSHNGKLRQENFDWSCCCGRFFAADVAAARRNSNMAGDC